MRRSRYRSIAAGFAFAASTMFAACATQQYVQPPAPPPPPPPVVNAQPRATPSITGVASWYGPGFNHRHTSTGQVYDQEDLTAACKVVPPGSLVMVTNLDNGRSVEVTITDHGPYRKGRKIDLSHRAAVILGMIDSGTANVRIDVISTLPGSRPVGSMPQFFVQVGSFSSEANARSIHDRVATYFPDVNINQVDAGGHRYYRVRMGGFASREQAETRAADTTRLGFPVVIVSE
jgi:rare lipoprotein A